MVRYDALAMAKFDKPLKPKGKCCKDDPRCAKCPVVLKRLCQMNLAERLDDGRVQVAPGIRKKDLKAARGRKA